MTLDEILAMLLDDAVAKCGGKGGRHGPCPIAKLEANTAKLGAEVAPQIKKSGKLRALYETTRDKVIGYAKALYAAEAPAWAMEHADIWLYENQLNVQGGSGTALAGKVVAYAAAKAVLGVKSLFKKSLDEQDLMAVAEVIHEFMTQVGAVTGYEVPTMEDLMIDLRQKYEEYHTT